jgi:omega-amidase
MLTAKTSCTGMQCSQAWGHSTVVSPNGEVVATTEHQSGIVYAELDLAEVEERRGNMPLTQQKRTDLYELVDKTA